MGGLAHQNVCGLCLESLYLLLKAMSLFCLFYQASTVSAPLLWSIQHTYEKYLSLFSVVYGSRAQALVQQPSTAQHYVHIFISFWHIHACRPHWLATTSDHCGSGRFSIVVVVVNVVINVMRTKRPQRDAQDYCDFEYVCALCAVRRMEAN